MTSIQTASIEQVIVQKYFEKKMLEFVDQGGLTGSSKSVINIDYRNP